MTFLPSAAGDERETRRHSARILIVDDLASSRLLIGGVLGAAGYGRLAYAADGVEALERIRDIRPDLIILDLIMPNMNGFEVCKVVRKEMGLDTPILVQTGVEEAAERIKAFDAGASDVVAKPIEAGELRSRVRLHLENRFLVEDLQRYHRRMEEELRSAEKMQLSLLKSDEEARRITARAGCRIQSLYRASNKLGGDLWDVFEMEEGRFGVFLADLTGHGVSAAINAFRLHLLVENSRNQDEDCGDWLTQIGERLHELLAVEHFATGFYGVFDRRTGVFAYAAAAAPPVLVMRASGDIEILPTAGVPLGASSGVRYETRSTPLRPGDRVMLYSDALVENFDNPAESLSPEALGAKALEVLQQGLDGAADRLAEAVLGGVDVELRDDLTLVLFEVAEPRIEHYSCRTLEEATKLADELAQQCPDPSAAGMGLRELLINAVEHGNLEIDGEDKQALLMEGGWREEVEKRLSDPRFKDRQVQVEMATEPGRISFLIRDEGEGFDFAAYDAADLPGEGYRGRGIAMARGIAFDQLDYLGRGNRVRASIVLDG